ncbi:MAG: hypothetical protein COV99_06355 [Bacteroidetes bacterium CG12_big_fil_rev_8_21_14_0_65_60_17]|nr:MAG: hypothetical protein COV99_06355 [Bacteroidetes bacterium CG12_big_fil_rev_8_21_14_0_65_60_17]
MIRLPAFFLLSALFLFAACASTEKESPVREIQRGEDVLTAMHDAYSGDWFETMTFVQTTIQHGPGGTTDTTLWYEALDLPGRLRIDIGEPDSGDMWLFRGDSIYIFTGGQLTQSGPTLHPLLLLGFDIYHEDPGVLASRMDSLGFDLARVHRTIWQEREVFVVGADEGDLTANQFWVDAERLLFVRLLQRQGASYQDVRFESYEPLGDAWVAPVVTFRVDSTLTLEERYGDMRHGITFSDGFFEPDRALSAAHWAQ